MLLNILQCIAQPPTIKNYLVQNVQSSQVEKFCYKPPCRFSFRCHWPDLGMWPSLASRETRVVVNIDGNDEVQSLMPQSLGWTCWFPKKLEFC